MADPSPALVAAARRAWLQGFLPATSGNLSARRPDGRLVVTESGRDKGALTEDELLVVDADGHPAEPGRRPSAETPLHVARYRADPAIGAIVHVHAPYGVVASRHFEDAVVLEGYELQKALRGVRSHDERVVVPIFDNDQDVDGLADRIEARLTGAEVGYLLRGHGLYAWGADVEEAVRHVEAFEALFRCVLEEHR